MMPRLFFAAAVGTETTETAATIDFQTALLLVMVVCLAFMAKALAELSRRVRELTEGRVSDLSPNGRLPAAGAPTTTNSEISPDVLAAISAAVFATLNHPVRIVAVDEVTAEHSRNWSLEGRRQIFTSHRVR